MFSTTIRDWYLVQLSLNVTDDDGCHVMTIKSYLALYQHGVAP